MVSLIFCPVYKYVYGLLVCLSVMSLRFEFISIRFSYLMSFNDSFKLCSIALRICGICLGSYRTSRNYLFCYDKYVPEFTPDHMYHSSLNAEK